MFRPRLLKGAVGDVDTGGRCGDSRACSPGLVGLGDRPAHGPGSQDGPKYLAGAGPSREPAPSCLEPFRDYLEARFDDDAHVDGTVLFGELAGLGFDRSYVTFVRELRSSGLRPRCEACRTGGHGVTTVLAHEPGEEIQWDWLELTETPWGEPAYVLVGALSLSGKCRAVFCEGESFRAPGRGDRRGAAPPGRHERGRGGPTGWRPSCYPGTDRLTAQFAQLAKHYGVRSGCARRAVRSARAWSRTRSST